MYEDEDLLCAYIKSYSLLQDFDIETAKFNLDDNQLSFNYRKYTKEDFILLRMRELNFLNPQQEAFSLQMKHFSKNTRQSTRGKQCFVKLIL